MSDCGPWLDVIEYAAERMRRELGVATLSVSRFDSGDAVLRTLVNAGHLGPGEERRPRHEVYPLARYPLVARLYAARRPYLSTPGAPGDAAAVACESALGKSSQAAAPLVVGGRVWGELWAASTSEQRPLTRADLPDVCAAAERFAAGLARLLADLRDGPRPRWAHGPMRLRARPAPSRGRR